MFTWAKENYWSRWRRNAKKFSRMRGENWKDPWQQPCCVKSHPRAPRKSVLIKWQQSRSVHQRRIHKRCSVKKRNLMNRRDNEQNLQSPKNMKTTLQAKVSFRWPITIWFTSSSPCHKQWKYQANAAVDKGWKKARDNSSVGFWKSQDKKRGYSGSTKRQKKHFAALMDKM